MTQLIDIDNVENMGLTEGEQKLLYNVEVLRLSVKRAGEMAGVPSPQTVLLKPHVVGAREQLRVQLRDRVNITREDVVRGLKDAIDDAKILADPMAQIAGWREIAKILGFDKTPNVSIHLTGGMADMTKQLQSMSLDELMKASGGDQIIDGAFYQVTEVEETVDGEA